MKNQASTIDNLLSIRNQLHGERGRLQTAGRALTPEELKRIEKLSNMIYHLDAAIKILQEDEDVPGQELPVKFKDGLYLAKNDHLKADLRIDIEGTNVISMDLFTKVGRDTIYMASLRTDPGAELKEKQKTFSIICEDKEGKVVQGKLSFYPSSETKTLVEFVLSDAIEGLAANTRVSIEATWKDKFFRKIGLETEIEQGLEELVPYNFDGRDITIKSCFEDSGILLENFGEADRIPSITGGWDDAQLHGLMTQFADSTLNKADWMLHMLLLSRARMQGLLGVMFDTGRSDSNGFPRQGAAIFLNEIAGHSAGTERKSIQTTVHELGHALNLAHRFEREVGRANSTSFMNYDWRYMGGRKSAEYWENFKFSFDKDEIRFMRHAPWWKLVPGGAEFHTVKYWNEGTGGYSPYAPEIPLTDLEMVISPPPTGPLFGFATPVYLEVKLTNRSRKKINIPEFYLDPKAGVLELVIKRISGNTNDVSTQKFDPIVSRCFDIRKHAKDVLSPNKSMTNNINLTFGSAGFTFAEPGNYEITAILSIWLNDNNYIVRSNRLPIRIAYPKDAEEEKDALKIFTKDVGYYLAFGGSDALPEAEKKLEEVKDRRLKIDKTVTDPLVAYIVRSQAINQSRDFVSFKKGKYSIREAKGKTAFDLFNQLKANDSKIFDKVTLKGTRDIMQKVQRIK